MNGTTIMIAAAAGLGGYLWWKAQKGKAAAAARRLIHVGGTGSAYSLPSTGGHRLVAQAGGIGAGINAPTETKAVVSTTRSPTTTTTRAAAVSAVQSHFRFPGIRPT